MKRRSLTVLVVFSVFILGPTITASADPSVLFSDNFDSYTAGTAPPSPWIQRYNSNSIIVSPGFGGAGNAVKLRGAWGWSDTLSVDLTFPDVFTFEVACKVENGAAAVGQLQFHGAMVSDENALWFAPDWSQIGWSDGTPIVPYCYEDTWYQAEVTISGYLGPNPTADVIVYDESGTQLGAQFGLPARNFADTPQQQLVLHTRSQPLNGQGAVACFDNVEVVPVPQAVLLGSIGLSLSGWFLHRRRTGENRAGQLGAPRGSFRVH